MGGLENFITTWLDIPCHSKRDNQKIFLMETQIGLGSLVTLLEDNTSIRYGEKTDIKLQFLDASGNSLEICTPRNDMGFLPG